MPRRKKAQDLDITVSTGKSKSNGTKRGNPVAQREPPRKRAKKSKSNSNNNSNSNSNSNSNNNNKETEPSEWTVVTASLVSCVFCFVNVEIHNVY